MKYQNYAKQIQDKLRMVCLIIFFCVISIINASNIIHLKESNANELSSILISQTEQIGLSLKDFDQPYIYSQVKFAYNEYGNNINLNIIMFKKEGYIEAYADFQLLNGNTTSWIPVSLKGYDISCVCDIFNSIASYSSEFNADYDSDKCFVDVYVVDNTNNIFFRWSNCIKFTEPKIKNLNKQFKQLYSMLLKLLIDKSIYSVI